jgi:hypothetical protein
MGNGDEAAPGDKSPAQAQSYDQAFFLALAAKGKDEWNKWRSDPANKDAYVTFAGVDFSAEPWDKSISRVSNSPTTWFSVDAFGSAALGKPTQ